MILGAVLAILALSAGSAVAEPALPEAAVTRIERLRITALAYAGKRIVAAGERGRILISNDQGNTWQSASSPSSASLTAVAFSSDQVGLAVGHNGTILRSEDGGKTWLTVNIDAKDQPALFAVHVDGPRAIVAGAYGAYYASSDGGKTWQRRSLLNADFDRHLTGIAAAGKGQLIIAGEAGTLLRSTDGGQQWAALKSPYEGSFFGILGLKNGTVIAYGMRGQAYRSGDAGEHWQRIDLGGSSNALQGGRELDDGRVLLYGNDGLLAQQGPGQDHFKADKLPTRRTLAAMLPVGDRLLTAGPGGLHWIGEDRTAK